MDCQLRTHPPSSLQNLLNLAFVLGSPRKGCDIVGLLQESKRPLPKKLRTKVRKGVPGASRPRGRRSSKKVEKKLKKGRKLEKNLKNSHFRLFFGVFRPRGREAPGTPFRTFFRSFLGRGLFDSCRRPTMSQRKGPKTPRFCKFWGAGGGGPNLAVSTPKEEWSVNGWHYLPTRRFTFNSPARTTQNLCGMHAKGEQNHCKPGRAENRVEFLA